MENSKDTHPLQGRLRFASAVYQMVMLAAFVIGLYGLLSLFSLASAEIQNAHIIGSLP